MTLPEAYEITNALDLIRRQGRLPPAELRFLTYIVDQTLAGRKEDLYQKVIAADVFARDLTAFNPRADSIVRPTAANLRERLLHYYAGPGSTDPLAIELPRGTYVPVFSRQPQPLNQPIQFYSCFISYSTKDQNFAERLHFDLQRVGVRCWFAPHDMRGGWKLHEQIDKAIRLYDRLLLILSDHSMNSEWVKTEITQARQRELNEKRHVLYPISLVPFSNIREWKCFDADTGKDSAREIREYFIPDFSNWNDDDAYQIVFQRLVKDLKAEAKEAEGNAPGGR